MRLNTKIPDSRHEKAGFCKIFASVQHTHVPVSPQKKGRQKTEIRNDALFGTSTTPRIRKAEIGADDDCASQIHM